MNEFLWQTFVTLLVIIDPFAVVPVFVNLTRGDTSEQKRRIAKKACLIAIILLLSFAFIGDKILDAMNISEPAFRIAGGFLLLLAAIDMVVARTSGGFRAPTGDETKEAIRRDDITVFPLAIPLIAGPGALTSTVISMRQAEVIGITAQMGVIFLLLCVMLLTFLSLLIGDRLMRLLGVTGTNVLTRVFGIILAAVAIESMIKGIVSVVRMAHG